MRDAVRGRLWEVSAWLDAGDEVAALHYLISLHPADQADILAELDDRERRSLLDRLEPDQLATVLEYLTPGELDHLAPQLEVDEIAAALDEAPAGAAADILHQLDEEEAEAVLEAMDGRSQVEPLLAHEDESAGGIMSPAVPALRGDQTADNAIDYLRAVGASAEEPYYLYVVDDSGRLEGVVGLRDLVVARPDRTMRELMNRDVLSVRTDRDQEVVLQTLQHYNLRALPVVDAEGRFVGVTTADDLLDVAQQEATEDMFRMVGLGASEEVGGPVAGSVGRRLPWLLVNLLTVFGAAATVSVFEDTLERAAVLAVFLPVVVGIQCERGRADAGPGRAGHRPGVVRPRGVADSGAARGGDRDDQRARARCGGGAGGVGVEGEWVLGAGDWPGDAGEPDRGRAGGGADPGDAAPVQRGPGAGEFDLRDVRDGRDGLLLLSGHGGAADRPDRVELSVPLHARGRPAERTPPQGARDGRGARSRWGRRCRRRW